MMFLSTVLVGLSALTLGLPVVALSQASVPLSTTARWIVDTNGHRVKLRCVNWAAHLEVNIPEGLHKQTINHTADFIASAGYNCVRLTYSIDMALNMDLLVSDSFDSSASAANVSLTAMQDLYAQAVGVNPFLANAKVIDVFDTVQSALWDRGVMTILDNHVSRAQWCCDLDDGNGWWSDAIGAWPANSKYFNDQNWVDGLTAMAMWAVGKPGIVGMSMRNELREMPTELPASVYTWKDRIPKAGSAVHAANPDVLIIVGGLNGGTDLSSLRGSTMDNSAWAGKNVWEAHVYSYTVITPNIGSCSAEQVEYGGWFGFVLDSSQPSHGPFWLSEFGVGMTGGPNNGLSDQDYNYLTCLVSYMENNDADWSHWAVQGSYYIRQGTVDVDETWGALDNDWATWRNPAFPGMLGQMWNVTQGP